MANARKLPVLIEFFYDVISPYSFLAFESLCRYKPKWNIELKLKPFLLVGIMKETGNSAPATVPNKAFYMQKDLKRLQNYFQVPLSLPDNIIDIFFNKGSLQAQRFVTAIDILEPQYTEEISRALWLRVYNLHEDITETESFKQAGKSIGMNDKVIDDALALMKDKKTKDRLHLYTQQALDYGAFGAPCIVVHVNGAPEMFFGSDRLELIAHTIGEKWEGPVPGSSSKL